MKEQEHHIPYLAFMLILSIYAVVALAVSTFVKLAPETRTILDYADTLVCVMFLVDFLFTLVKAKNRARYFVTWGWLDLLSSIPAVNVLRWGRGARILRIFRVLRGIKATKILSEFILYRRAHSAFLAALLVSLLLIVFSASSVLQFESGPDANIRTPEDAVWWAVVTLTTVGYGDKYPLSTEGRLIAVLLMTAGVGLFGTFSGFVAAWFLEAPGRTSAELEELKCLRAEIRELRGMLEPTRGAEVPTDPEAPAGG
jgi:voltage-gated potassium channel